MRNNVRKKMRLICLLFAMVLLAGVPAAAKDRKNQKAAAENVSEVVVPTRPMSQRPSSTLCTTSRLSEQEA